MTTLFINNVMGPGAVTTGNGILVVDAINGGKTATGSFNQGGEIVAGPYEYTLYQGGLNGSNPNNWYLRSITPSPEPIPPSPDLPPGFIPNYRPIVSLYTATPSIAMLYNQLLLDTLHQRVSEEEQIHFNPSLPSRPYANGEWFRVIGENGERKNGSIFKNGPDFDYQFGAIQGGVDLYHQRYSNSHSDFAGVFGAIGKNRGDVENIFKQNTGTDHFNAYTGGAYWTHFGPNGWYLDALVDGTVDQIKADNTRDNDQLNTIGKNWGVSLEGGYPIKIFYDFVVEPQARHQRNNSAN